MSTKENILSLANVLIQKNGYMGFSYANLADELGIRKASIHHHFPTKTDLGIAYCNRKAESFARLEKNIATLPAGKEQLEAYLRAFSKCSNDGGMCGVYAMLSDSNLFSPELKKAVADLALYELAILKKLLEEGREANQFFYNISAEEMAVMVSNALKGALLLNRIPPHDTCEKTVNALIKALCDDNN